MGWLCRSDLLAQRKPGSPAISEAVSTWPVDALSARVRLGARRFTCLQQQLKIDLLEHAAVSPVVEIALHGGKRRKVLRQHPPLTTGPRDIQDRIEHAAQLGLTRSAQTLDRGHMRLNQRPFGIRQIACVALSRSLILPASDFGPHLVPR